MREKVETAVREVSPPACDPASLRGEARARRDAECDAVPPRPDEALDLARSVGSGFFSFSFLSLARGFTFAQARTSAEPRGRSPQRSPGDTLRMPMDETRAATEAAA